MSENPGVFESNFTRLRPFYSFYILPRIFIALITEGTPTISFCPLLPDRLYTEL